MSVQRISETDRVLIDGKLMAITVTSEIRERQVLSGDGKLRTIREVTHTRSVEEA